jgi:transposase-like protein
LKRKRHTPDQIIRKLRKVDKLQAGGASLADASKAVGVSENTLHRWRKEYGGGNPELMKRMSGLEKENARLKKAVADLTLDNQILSEVAEGNF